MPKKDSSRASLRRLACSLRDLRERHRDRHRPTGFGFVFADRVDYLDPVRWEAVTAGRSLFLRREVLRVMENHGPENIRPRYAMIFRDAQPVATLVAQIVTLTGDHLNLTPAKKSDRLSRLLQKAMAPAAKTLGAQIRDRMLVAGNLLTWGFHGIAFRPGENPAQLWPGVAEALYRIRRAERLSGQTNVVMVKDITPQQTGLEALHRFSYRPMETEPDMVLAIDPSWNSYDDYLAALDAKYRKNARHQFKKLSAAGCTIEPLTDLAAHRPRLHELYLSVQANAAVRLVTVPETYLSALASAVGDDFRCSVVRRDEEILGFVTSIRDGDTAIGYYLGFDRTAAAAGLPLYLRLLHATISHAIAWRCKRLSLGRTALEPKAGLGAQPEPISVWMRHRVPAINWILRGLLGAVPHDDAPERNPFKTSMDEK